MFEVVLVSKRETWSSSNQHGTKVKMDLSPAGYRFTSSSIQNRYSNKGRDALVSQHGAQPYPRGHSVPASMALGFTCAPRALQRGARHTWSITHLPGPRLAPKSQLLGEDQACGSPHSTSHQQNKSNGQTKASVRRNCPARGFENYHHTHTRDTNK